MEVRHVELAIEDQGRGSPVVLVHGTGVSSAYDFWCNLMQSPSNRSAIYDDAGTQFGAGNWVASNQTCTGSYWTLAYGNAQTSVPKIPAASAIYNPPNPFNTSQFYFASNYFDRNQIRQVAQRTGAQAVIVPENTNGAPGVNTYFDLMSTWVNGLASAFKGGAS